MEGDVMEFEASTASWRRGLACAVAILSVAACGGNPDSSATDSVVDPTPTTDTVPADATETTAPGIVDTVSEPSSPTTVASTTAPVTAAPTTAPAGTAQPTLPPIVTPQTTAPPPPPTTPPTTAATPPTTAAPPPPPATTAPCRVVESNETARRGDCGDTVVFIQERLTVLGFPTAADGLFGPGTEAAIQEFQASRGLDNDGIVGPLTWAALTEGGIGD